MFVCSGKYTCGHLTLVLVCMCVHVLYISELRRKDLSLKVHQEDAYTHIARIITQ